MKINKVLLSGIILLTSLQLQAQDELCYTSSVLSTFITGTDSATIKYQWDISSGSVDPLGSFTTSVDYSNIDLGGGTLTQNAQGFLTIDGALTPAAANSNIFGTFDWSVSSAGPGTPFGYEQCSLSASAMKGLLFAPGTGGFGTGTVVGSTSGGSNGGAGLVAGNGSSQWNITTNSDFEGNPKSATIRLGANSNTVCYCPVPEPSAALLGLLGGGALALRRRRY